MLRCNGAGAEVEAATNDIGTAVPPFSLPFWVLTEDPDPTERCTIFSSTCFTKSLYLSFIVLLELGMFHVYSRMKHGKFGCDLE
jgi:fumarate reductase subunit D